MERKQKKTGLGFPSSSSTLYLLDTKSSMVSALMIVYSGKAVYLGGTVTKLINNGHSVVLVDLTNGEPTPYGSLEKRKLETENANKILGVKKRVMLPINNREVFDTLENRKLLANIIREYRPGIIFIPYPQDAHPDHVQASALCVAARFYAKLTKADLGHEPFFPRRYIYYFCTHLRLTLQPSFVFDISDCMEAKLAAVRAYESQFIENEKNQIIFERLKIENGYWGQQSNCVYAEPFVAPELIKINSTPQLLNL